MKYGELKKLLRKHGCFQDGEYTNHEKWYSPITGRHFPVPRHNSQEAATKTVTKIKKDAGL